MTPAPSFLRLSIALVALPLVVAGCGHVDTNRQLYSVHQPVVSQTTYALDLSASPGGLPAYEQQRLAGWFVAMDLRYGDQLTIEDPAQNPAAVSAVRATATKYGVVIVPRPTIGDANYAPPAPGTLRVTLIRASAGVPHCPDWSANHEGNPNNGLSTNFGCAVNSNIAAMVANPNDLLHGATDAGNSQTATSDKAITSYRNAKPTGDGGLKKGT